MTRSVRIEKAMGHLGAAVAQSLPSDDQIIMGHVREALALISEEWRLGSDDPPICPQSEANRLAMLAQAGLSLPQAQARSKSTGPAEVDDPSDADLYRFNGGSR